ncbi:hypothetical protein [Brevibacterium pityocampae]|uniref:hypothetical protein n=1 Tax=Brevibacterium pityocampae TaxID=506594 RepID=UPI0031E9E7D5
MIQTLSLEGLQALVDLALEIKGEQAILSSVVAKLGNDKLSGTDASAWQAQASVDEPTLRSAIADAATAKDKEWFKREDRGEELAAIVIAHGGGLENTHLLQVIGELRDFVYPAALEPVDIPEQSANG